MGIASLPGLLRAVWNFRESSGTQEWRLLWAQRRILPQAAGRLSSQASMSLRRQPTARAPSLTGPGNSPRWIIS